LLRFASLPAMSHAVFNTHFLGDDDLSGFAFSSSAYDCMSSVFSSLVFAVFQKFRISTYHHVHK
jgi:hypothetical protein